VITIGYFVPNFSVREQPVGGDCWETLEPSEFIDGTGRRWIMPTGFIYNGSSIPGPVQWLLGNPNSAPWKMPGKFHDYLRYECNDEVHKWWAAELYHESLLAIRRDFHIDIPLWKLKIAKEAVARFG
jgi:hypothetical protein